MGELLQVDTGKALKEGSCYKVLSVCLSFSFVHIISDGFTLLSVSLIFLLFFCLTCILQIAG